MKLVKPMQFSLTANLDKTQRFLLDSPLTVSVRLTVVRVTDG